MKVLVTGGTGYIGRRLSKMGAKENVQKFPYIATILTFHFNKMGIDVQRLC